MIKAKKILKILKDNNISFITGVPDSVLKSFTNELSYNKFFSHLIVPNEGTAIASGIGYNLATNKIPLIYFQNSGLGNAINPLISLTNKKIYSTAFLYFIGWRGATGTKDEPQHIPNGKITKKLLNLLDIQYHEVNSDKDLKKISLAIKLVKKNIPQCILFKKDKIYGNKTMKKNSFKLSKEDVFNQIYKNCKNKTYIFCSTGFNSRSLYNYNKSNPNRKIKCFYLVGGMGHTFGVANIFASLKKNNKIICIDGDGSLLMHLGSLNLNKSIKSKLTYILLNNNCHDSVGGQNTYIKNLNLEKLSKIFGFKKYYKCSKNIHLKNNFKYIKNDTDNIFYDCLIRNETKKLPRPDEFIKIKNDFMI